MTKSNTMKTLFKSWSIAVLLTGSLPAIAQVEIISSNPNQTIDTSKKSIHAMVSSSLNGDSAKILYYSPGVRNRVIWGGLVPYDKVWVTGAHNATSLQINKGIVLGKKAIPPGKYALFTIPGKKTWIIILNRNWEQHLASEYDEKDDIIRLKLKPRKNRFTERLQYFITGERGHRRNITMTWEKIKIEIPFRFED